MIEKIINEKIRQQIPLSDRSPYIAAMAMELEIIHASYPKPKQFRGHPSEQITVNAGSNQPKK